MRRCTFLILACTLASPLIAQDHLRSWPVMQRFKKDSDEQSGLIKMGRTQTRWVDGSHLAYRKDNDWWIVTLPSGQEAKSATEPQESGTGSGRANANTRRRRPGRGGQFDESLSADGKVRAFYKDANVWLQREGGGPESVTSDGDLSKRIKYGTGSWVYGEELGQTEAMGMNASGTKLWYYRFDETKVIDNMVVFKQATPHPTFVPEAYPKPGSDNPAIDLYICDTKSQKSVKVKVRPGAFDDGMGHYVYDIQWSYDGKQLFFRRTDRRQKTMEFCAADPDTGDVRVIVSESWPQSYAENKLGAWFFDGMDGIDKRSNLRGKMLWESQRNGFVNLYIVDLSTGKTTTVTNNQFDETRIVKIDLEAGKVFYMAHGGDNPYMDQLYSVGLDGSSNKRATDPAFDHNVTLSPDGQYAVDVADSCQDPPVTRLIDMNGRIVKVLAQSDVSAFKAAGYSLPERIEFTSADGKTKICGVLHKPRNFDPMKKYPLIIDVYGGPLDAHSGGFSENFRAYDPETGFGVLKASFDNRGTGGRGKVFSDPLYGHMGVAEIDDQAEGAKAVIAKGYVDPEKVGITGTSYGGYASTMCLLRHPEVYKAAVASSSVTDWHNYDTTYTERYMGLANEDEAGYSAGSAMTYARDLKGWLMLYYGTADENVHPCNTLQLLQKFRQAGKSVEVQVGTDMGHSGVDTFRAWEFFFERLHIDRN